MSNYIPVAGDEALVNGTVATIQSIDLDTDRVVYVIALPGGSTDTITAHVSQTRFTALYKPQEPKRAKPND